MKGRHFLFACLLTLPFLSKLSFHWIPGLPDKVSILWLQGGMHPVMNSVLSVLLIAIAAAAYMKTPSLTHTEKVYLTGLGLFSLLIVTQAALQAAFVDLNVPIDFHLAGVALTGFLIFGYGWILPGLGSRREFFEILTAVTRIFMLLSLFVLAVSPGAAFKGTRFIGAFKQIPYMVTCAQVALLVETANLFGGDENVRRKRVAGFFCALAFVAIVLTGARSAFLAALGFLAMAYWKAPALSEKSLWSKRTALYVASVFALTVGPFAAQALVGFMRGETSFGMRVAQDGVASRVEEVERGWISFEQEPWFGHGLLYRFGSPSLEDAGSYNSFRDPHNLFVSAGVIGGWPMLAFIGLALLTLCWALGLRIAQPVATGADYRRVLLTCFLISHLPILIVYHMHLSLGGLADRMYWLTLGMIARGPQGESYE